MVCRVLLALALILNGTAMPPAAAMAAASDAADHSGHHMPNPPAGQAATDESGELPGSCCYGIGCDCGCAGPHAVPLAAGAAPGAWNATPAASGFSSALLLPDLIAAPFRPPA